MKREKEKKINGNLLLKKKSGEMSERRLVKVINNMVERLTLKRS